MTEGPPPEDGEPSPFPLWAMILLLLAIGFSLFRSGSGRPGLLEQDEPRYAVTARNMARGGDWLVPEFNGRERLVKPPLAYWAIATSFRMRGAEDESRARLPSAAAGALAVLLAALGGWWAWGRRRGPVAGMLLASMFVFWAEARLATTDMIFTLFFTGAAAALLPAIEGSPRGGRWILLSGVLAGIGALAKTPLAIVLPPVAAAGAAWMTARRTPDGAARGADRPRRLGSLILASCGALALFAAVFLSWYLAADRATDGRLGEELRRELSMRTDPDSDTHPAAFWYYLWVLPAAVLPWTFLLPAGVAACLRAVREGGPGAATAAYALALPAVVLLFFSALPSKLPAYVLPALPPLAVVVAGGLREMMDRPGSREAALGRLWGGWGGIAFGAATAVLPWVPALRERVGEEALRAALPALAVTGACLAGGGMLLVLRKTVAGVAVLSAATFSLILTGDPILPHLEQEKCARGLVAAMKAEGLAPGDRIYDTGNSLKGVPWYADRTTETKPDGSSPPEAAAVAALSGRERAWVIAEHDPAEARARGKRTQWERILQDLSPGAPVPRVVFRGMRRIVVTNVPVR